MVEQGPDGGRADDAPQAPAGWYPDPRDGGRELYWDGSAWTGQSREQSAPPLPARASRKPPLSAGGKLLMTGGIALGVSPLFTWLNVVLLGSLNLFQLFRANGDKPTLAWGAVIAGAAVAVVAYQDRSRATRHWLGLAAGLGAGALAVYALSGLRHGVERSAGLVTVGTGPYIAIAGCLAMIVGALLPEPAALGN